MPDARKLILKNYLSPGDVLCMTAAVHSLHRAFPGRYRTAVDTSCSAIWEYNPDVEPLEKAREEGGYEIFDMQYNVIHQSNQRAIHVLEGYCSDLSNRLGEHVPLLTNRPLLYLSVNERQWLNQVQEATGRETKFWLVNAGVKACFTAKQYPWYQEVVDRLQGRVQFVQVGRAEHKHIPLRGVIDFLNKTDDRQLIRLVANAQGVLSGVSWLMHLGAAFQKPGVILAGGREPRQWNCYATQTLFCTVGQLDCCRTEACWKSRAIRLDDGTDADTPDKICTNPCLTSPPSTKCMAMISPESVAEEILKFS